MSADYTIVFPPTMLWANHQRPHHVLTQLARRHPVRCLFNDWTVDEEVLEGGRLIVTKRAFRRRYHQGPLVYYFSIPDKLDYLRRPPFPRPDLFVFELMDLPEAEFADWKKKLPRALERADLVRTTHPAITAYLQEHHAARLGETRVTTSYNGVDLELFDPAAQWTRPAELAGVEKPILGFYGNLDGWIDWPLIGRLAELPDYQVVVVGGTEGMAPKIPAELRSSSVLWIGKRPVTDMPAFLSAFDVALFPFVVNEMTDAVDPLKVWEYFSFGRPVLATRTSLVRENPELFEAVDAGDLVSREALDGAVRSALASGRDAGAAARRRAAAHARDWGAVADELHHEIVGTLGGRRRNP
jgi:glycosyltransferase involved in cell wall biosynthesis